MERKSLTPRQMRTKSEDECLSRIKSAYREGLEEGWNSGRLISVSSRLCNLAKFRPERKEFYYRKAIDYLKEAREKAEPHEIGSIDLLIAKGLFYDFGYSNEALKYAKRALGLRNNEAVYEVLHDIYESLGDYPKANECSLSSIIPSYEADIGITENEVENTNIDDLMDQLTDPKNLNL